MSGKRPPLMAGNWKMNLSHREAVNYLDVFRKQPVLQDTSEATAIVLIPSYIALPAVQAYVKEHAIPIEYGGQDLSPLPSGPHTGDVSGSMLADLGCTYVLVGHSERRRQHAETDSVIHAKTKAAFSAGLEPIICVGESLEVRRKGGHVDYTLAQVAAALTDAREQEVASAVIAYEPVWAIGTGEVATPADAQEVCGAIRELVKEKFTPELSDALRVIYGGSVTGNNITEILAGADVDGALVGGASLDPKAFAAICRAASSKVEALG